MEDVGLKLHSKMIQIIIMVNMDKLFLLDYLEFHSHLSSRAVGLFKGKKQNDITQ